MLCIGIVKFIINEAMVKIDLQELESFMHFSRLQTTIHVRHGALRT